MVRKLMLLFLQKESVVVDSWMLGRVVSLSTQCKADEKVVLVFNVPTIVKKPYWETLNFNVVVVMVKQFMFKQICSFKTAVKFCVVATQRLLK